MMVFFINIYTILDFQEQYIYDIIGVKWKIWIKVRVNTAKNILAMKKEFCAFRIVSPTSMFKQE